MKPFIIKNTLLTTAIIMAVSIWSCKEDDQRPPVVYSASPQLPMIGDTITIEGDNFAPYAFDNLVYLNGKVVMEYISATARQLRVIVPPGAMSGDLVVDIRGLRSAPIFIDVFKRDVQILSVTPDNSLEAPPGSIIEVKGKNFLPDHFLNGKASFRFTDASGSPAVPVIYVDSATLQVVVPADVKTGPVYVWQEGFIYEGPRFSIAQPELLTVSQPQAQEGDLITVTGKGLGSITNFRIDGVIAFPEQNMGTEAAFRVNAGVRTGSHVIEFEFENGWITSTQTIEILPLQNIVRSVYWIQNGKLVRTSIEGGGATHTAFAYTGEAKCLAQDPQSGIIYAGAGSAILAIDATGRPRELYTQDVGNPYDITVSDGKLYWFDGSFFGIRSAPVSGSGSISSLYLADHFVNCNGVEVVDNELYWVDLNNRQLLHGKTDGSGTAEAISFSEGSVNYPMDVDIVRVNGKLMVYVVDRPDYVGAGTDVFVYVGELGAGEITLSPFGTLSSTTGAPYGVSYVTIDQARQKIVWGNNYDFYATQLWQSDLNGTNPELLLTENGGYAFDNVVVIE